MVKTISGEKKHTNIFICQQMFSKRISKETSSGIKEMIPENYLGTLVIMEEQQSL